MNNDLIPGPPREDRDRDSQAKVTGVTSTPQSHYHKGATGEALGARAECSACVRSDRRTGLSVR